MLVSVEGGKPEYPEKDPRSRDEDQQQTQPTNKMGGGGPRGTGKNEKVFKSLPLLLPAPLINNERPIIAVDYNQ